MREIEVYNFSELTDEAKKNAIDNLRFKVMDDIMDGYNSEYMDSLEKLADATGFEATRICVDYSGYSVTAQLADNNGDSLFDHFAEEGITGKLLFRYVNRYIMPNLAKGKWFCTSYRRNPDTGNMTLYCDGKKHKERNSRIMIDYNRCALTGMCYELAFEKKLLDFYYHWNTYSKNYSLIDLMQDCYDEFFKAWHSEYEYWSSDEGVKEALQDGNYEFYEDGSEF